MPQHFLLSAEARSLSVREIFTLSDDQAFDLFRELRWGKGRKSSVRLAGSLSGTGFWPVASSGDARRARTPSR